MYVDCADIYHRAMLSRTLNEDPPPKKKERKKKRKRKRGGLAGGGYLFDDVSCSLRAQHLRVL